MLTLTYQFQLQPNRQQEEEMSSLETARKVYNHALAEKKDRSSIHAAWNCSGRTYRRKACVLQGRRESRPGGTIAVASEPSSQN